MSKEQVTLGMQDREGFLGDKISELCFRFKM